MGLLWFVTVLKRQAKESGFKICGNMKTVL